MRTARLTPRARQRTWIALLTLTGCISYAVPPAAEAADKVAVKTEITTAADLNPNRDNRPSPIVLFTFQLKTAEAFENADFFSLTAAEATVLGGDLIERTQSILQPGVVLPLEAEFDEEARFLGFVAAFRDIEKAQWRAVVELPEKGFLKKMFSRTKLMIAVESLAVTASLD
jgi:type VI secretion system protein VasD